MITVRLDSYTVPLILRDITVRAQRSFRVVLQTVSHAYGNEPQVEAGHTCSCTQGAS